MFHKFPRLDAISGDEIDYMKLLKKELGEYSDFCKCKGYHKNMKENFHIFFSENHSIICQLPNDILEQGYIGVNRLNLNLYG